MNESIQVDTAETKLPRLRIHHFFVLTTVFAVVMSVWLGILHLVRAFQPNQAVPEFTTGISFFFIVQTLSQSACAAVALLGLAWRETGGCVPQSAWALDGYLFDDRLGLRNRAYLCLAVSADPNPEPRRDGLGDEAAEFGLSLLRRSIVGSSLPARALAHLETGLGRDGIKNPIWRL